MTKFQTLFGLNESHVRKTCVLLPFAGRDILARLGAPRFSKGKLYSSANTKDFTLIHTGMGPALLGDAVLYLGDTACRNIILFGSCGLVKEDVDLNIGALVAPGRCYSFESFTEMLSKIEKERKIFYPDGSLLENLLKFKNVKIVTCATLGSLKLEEDHIDIFKEKKIQVVDMEASALFSAAKLIDRKAAALFYITDIINKKPFYEKLEDKDKSALLSSIKSGSRLLCEFIKKNLNG